MAHSQLVLNSESVVNHESDDWQIEWIPGGKRCRESETKFLDPPIYSGPERMSVDADCVVTAGWFHSDSWWGHEAVKPWSRRRSRSQARGRQSLQQTQTSFLWGRFAAAAALLPKGPAGEKHEQQTALEQGTGPWMNEMADAEAVMRRVFLQYISELHFPLRPSARDKPQFSLLVESVRLLSVNRLCCPQTQGLCRGLITLVWGGLLSGLLIS